jgi:lipoprotein-anchoring transpeptidase ErfK/SrfK
MKKFIVGAIAFFAFCGTAVAQPYIVDITIDISEQSMFIQTPEGQALWPVSTGKNNYDTPTGIFQPQRLEYEYYSKKYDDAPMPYSIFFTGGYAIHGTEHVAKLGRKASHGCVRLEPGNASVLYEIVEYYGPESTIIRIVP